MGHDRLGNAMVGRGERYIRRIVVNCGVSNGLGGYGKHDCHNRDRRDKA